MNNYDIIIAGGGTAGCACAYTAGKYGLKVLLLESNSYLGGSITSSLVIPAMKTSDNAINNNFFNLLYNELIKLNGAETFLDGNKGWFNPELTKIALDKMMSDANVKVIFESSIEKIEEKLSVYTVTIRNNNSIRDYNSLLSCIETKLIVDATGDANICKLLNCKFLDDYDNNQKTQPVSLRFIMSGIDIKQFANWLKDTDNDTKVTSVYTVNDNILLSTAYTWDTDNKWALAPIFKDAIENNIITESDSNYFQIFSVAGTTDSIAFNCPRLLDTNLSRSESYIQGRQSILRLSNFCKMYFPGFKNAYISSIANTLGVRVSRRVQGKYIYTKDDLVTGKKFDNPVVISNYPIDIHSNNKNESVLQHAFVEYQLPVESLIIKDNLYVIGRCISAEFEAQAALRIIPSCFSMGEGLAKYLVNKVLV